LPALIAVAGTEVALSIAGAVCGATLLGTVDTLEPVEAVALLSVAHALVVAEVRADLEFTTLTLVTTVAGADPEVALSMVRTVIRARVLRAVFA